MRIKATVEMRRLWQEIEPFFDNHFNIRNNAPQEIKEKGAKWMKLSKEQHEAAEKLNNT